MGDGRPHDPELTVLSDGAGQDSFAILLKLTRNPAFRARWAPHRLLGIHADTGNEHEETYAHLRRAREVYAAADVPFIHVTADLGFHTPLWRTLGHFFRAKSAIMAVAYPKSCTDNLKVRPFYKVLEAFIADHPAHQRYGFARSGKRGLYQYAERFGKIRVLLGIARGEERRVAKASSGPKWMAECIERVYPLIELGWNRADVQAYIESQLEVVPPPSNCIMCPFKSLPELLWTFRHYPAQFAEWERYEATKIEAWRERTAAAGKKNHGVFGIRTLHERVTLAEAQFGWMSDAELTAHRMTHGHCVTAAY